ncbi:metallophosphoesterase family protein [Azotobacter armeniacus]
MSKIRRFERNIAGRDFAVGDIHGHFSKLQVTLDAAGFNPRTDRLFSVGDLVDRGPESDQALEWLAKPWFIAVQGNHEELAVQYALTSHVGDFEAYLASGASWFLALPKEEQQAFAVQFAELPIAIEVKTEEGLVGLVHADCPLATWDDFRLALSNPALPERMLEQIKVHCQWSRRRIDAGDESAVLGVRAVVVGHTWLRRPAVLGNVYHIDTGAWLSDGRGYFTLLELDSLKSVLPVPKRLDWEEQK